MKTATQLRAELKAARAALRKTRGTLRTLRADARMALDGRWDKSADGFTAQMDVINTTLAETRDAAK